MSFLYFEEGQNVEGCRYDERDKVVYHHVGNVQVSLKANKTSKRPVSRLQSLTGLPAPILREGGG